MIERNRALLSEIERLEKGGFKGKTILHWIDGIAKIIEYPRRSIQKDLYPKVGEKNAEEKKRM